MELRGRVVIFDVDLNLEGIKSLSCSKQSNLDAASMQSPMTVPLQRPQLMGWSLHHFFVFSTSFDALAGLKEEAKTKPELKLDR